MRLDLNGTRDDPLQPSTVREKAGLESDDYGAPMDVLWFRMSRKESDNTDTFGHIEAGKLVVMLDRGDYWQCAYVIRKGGIEQVKSEGLETSARGLSRCRRFWPRVTVAVDTLVTQNGAAGPGEAK